MLLLLLLLVSHDRVMLDRLAHGPWEQHRRRVLRLRLLWYLLPRRRGPLTRHAESVVPMRIRRPRVAIRDVAVDLGCEEMLRVLRRLLRSVLRLVRRRGM